MGVGVFARVYRWYYTRRYSLKSAIRCGNMRRLQKLLRYYVEQGVVWKRVREEWKVGSPVKVATPLMMAYLYGEGEMVQELIRHGASLREEDATALMKLCVEDSSYYYPQLLKKVLIHSPLMNEELLIYACMLRHYDVIEDLLQRGLSGDCKMGSIHLSTNPMTISAELGDDYMLSILLRYGVKPNYRALVVACMRREWNVEYVRMLLKYSALSPDVYLNHKNMYLLQYVLERDDSKRNEMVRILLERGAQYFYLLPKHHRCIFAACTSATLRIDFYNTLQQHHPCLLPQYTSELREK